MARQHRWRLAGEHGEPEHGYHLDMATIFTKIIDGELPARFIWKDETCVVFLSINPMQDGHALVVPRDEVDHWVDADDDVLAHLTNVARIIGLAQQQVFPPDRIGLMIAGLEVPHLHIHVVPMTSVRSLDFATAEANPDPGRLDRNAELLREELRAMGRSEVAD